MDVLDRTAQVWAVVDATSELVVVAYGADAGAFVAECVYDGWRALRLDAKDLSAA